MSQPLSIVTFTIADCSHGFPWTHDVEVASGWIETVSPEGTFCDTVEVPSGAGDMQLN